MNKIILLLIFSGFATMCSPQTRVYKNLVMEGAGIRGFGFTGAIEVIDSLGFFTSVERVGGTSSGAILATLLAVGYTPHEIKNIIADIPLKKFNDGAKFFLGGWKRL